MENTPGETAHQVIVVTATEGASRESVSERVEDVARAAATVAIRGARVAADRNLTELRRAAVDLVAFAGVVVACLTAFAFGNWAAASALTTAVRGWVAAVILAAGWIVVAAVLVAVLLRGERALPQSWRRVSGRGPGDSVRSQQAFDDAERAFRTALDSLADVIADAAERKIAAAILPLAGGMVAVGEEMVDATDEVIEAADEITDVIEERLPGGVVVNRAVDFALVPGRFGIRVARTVLNFGQPPR
jgi:hypothetical protein